MREVGHFIGGKHVAGTSGRTADIFQPMTGEVIGTVALASKASFARRSRTPWLRSPPGPPPTRSAGPAS